MKFEDMTIRQLISECEKCRNNLKLLRTEYLL